MARRKLSDNTTRKILKLGNSYAVTLPIAMITKLKWRQGQKVVCLQRGTTITIKDWE